MKPQMGNFVYGSVWVNWASKRNELLNTMLRQKNYQNVKLVSTLQSSFENRQNVGKVIGPEQRRDLTKNVSCKLSILNESWT